MGYKSLRASTELDHKKYTVIKSSTKSITYISTLKQAMCTNCNNLYILESGSAATLTFRFVLMFILHIPQVTR